MANWTEKQKKAHARNYAIFLLRGQYGVLQHIEHTTLVSTAQTCCEIDNILTAMGAETNQARRDKLYEEVVKEWPTVDKKRDVAQVLDMIDSWTDVYTLSVDHQFGLNDVVTKNVESRTVVQVHVEFFKFERTIGDDQT